MELIERARLLQAAQQDIALQKQLIAQCRKDVVFWFNTFVYTDDPRVDGPTTLPFNLYPFQEDLVRGILDDITNNRDWGVEKSRDMGVSWLVSCLLLYIWLFRPGWNTHIGSRRENEVDTSTMDPSTIFGKIRIALAWLPPWMTPPYRDKLLTLENKLTNTYITGESQNPTFGRGKRQRAIVFDEMAFWQYGALAYGGCSETTRSRGIISTPYGKGNRFAELMLHPETYPELKRYRAHWRDHPHKDEAWYEAQKMRLTVDEVARELDIDYNLSVTGRVFAEFTSRRHISPKPLKVDKSRPVYRIWDFGKTNAVLYGQIGDKGDRRVLFERVLRDSNTTEQLQTALSDSINLFNGCVFRDICDPAGQYDDGRGLPPHIEMLKQQGVRPTWEKITAIPTASRKANAIEAVKRDLQLCLGDSEMFLVDEQKAPILIEAMGSEYKYKVDVQGHTTDKIEEKHPHEDIIDCLLYWYLEAPTGSSYIDPRLYKVTYNNR